MMNVVIIDDERDARFLLANFIRKSLSRSVHIVGEADDVITGIKLIEEKKPQLVFLDVQMKTGTGFDLLSHFETINFEIIFVTAYDRFAIQAFKFSAFDYILKPFKGSDIELAINKLIRIMDKAEKSGREMKVLIENYGTKGEIQKLIVPSIPGFEVLEISSILSLEGDRNYTRFVLKGGIKILSSKNLGEYEELLADYGFFRIHQSTIISLRHVKSFKKADDGYVELTDGSTHKVSRNRKQTFISRFTNPTN